MDKMHKVMREFKEGKLHSGSKHGPEVTSRAQAIAIGMSEARSAKHKALKKKTRYSGEKGATRAANVFTR